MSKRQILLFLGICILILPTRFVGIPFEWKKYVIMLIGACLIAISYFSKKESGEKQGSQDKKHYASSTFVDSSITNNAHNS